MERRTICYQPNQERSLCNNLKGDGKCGNCRISLDWILQINDKNPEKKLKIFTSDTSICLRQQEHRPTLAKVSTGIFIDNTTPSSPKQQ